MTRTPAHHTVCIAAPVEVTASTNLPSIRKPGLQQNPTPTTTAPDEVHPLLQALAVLWLCLGVNQLTLPPEALAARSTLAASFICCTLLQDYLLHPLFMNLSSAYAALPALTQVNWRVRVLGVMHAVIVCCWCLHLRALDHESLKLPTKIWGSHPDAAQLSMFATGYFLWDLWITIRYFSLFNASFLAHGALCFVIFNNSVRPFSLYYASVFLLFEASTPTVNLYWFLNQLGFKEHWVSYLNAVVTMLLFLSVRIMFGFYHSYHYWGEALQELREPQPLEVVSQALWLRRLQLYFLLMCNTVLCGLNAVWFSSQVRLFWTALSR